MADNSLTARAARDQSRADNDGLTALLRRGISGRGLGNPEICGLVGHQLRFRG